MMNARCPVCDFCCKEEDLAEHLLGPYHCLTPLYIGKHISTAICWCSYGLYYIGSDGSRSSDINESDSLTEHLRKMGGADQHYTDCLMGVKPE